MSTTKVITGKVRFSYVNIFKSRAFQAGQDAKYSVCLLIPKEDKATIKKIKAAIDAAVQDGISSKWGGKKPANLKLPLRDGDAERADEAPEYEGMYFLNCNSTQKPGIVDKDLNEILDPDEVYSGCWGRASINFFPFNTNGNKGIGVGLNNIQKLKDDDRLALPVLPPSPTSATTSRTTRTSKEDIQMHRVMGVDIETYSSVDLTEAGVYAYVEAPDFDILLISYIFDDWGEDDVKTIDCFDADPDMMAEFCEALLDPQIVKTAFNANFERTCLAKWLQKPMPPEEWRCTMVKALTLGLPGNLAGAGEALGLPPEKLKDPQGKALIQFFSKPCKPTRTNGQRTRNLPQHDPAKWQLYKGYNRQDVVTEQEILRKLSIYKTPESEQELWALDQHMNDNGVALDIPMVEKIVEYDTRRRQELQEEAQELTGLKNPNSLAQLKRWLAEQGVEMTSVTKDTIAEALRDPELPDVVRRVLEIRTALGKTSVAKYSTMLVAHCQDHRLRGILQFYGANRSGRWAGRLVQTHNLAKNTLPDLALARELAAEGDFETMGTLFGETAFVFSELIRTAFIPSEGCRFVVSDFSAIEARVLAWIAGEEWTLEAFRQGKDIYCETASMMYHVPVEKHGANSHLRQKGKVAVLACGYQGGVGAMKRMDKGGTIPEDELQSVVDQWRGANPNVVKLWRNCELAARTVIEEHRTVRLKNGIAFGYINGNLFIKLPSGRKLCYWNTRLKMDPRDGREHIVYMGVNQETKQWGETETYGGKLVENITQAIARDCLAISMQRVAALGYNIVMHVHDEMIVDVPIEDTDALERINACMGEAIPWAPGLPLRGDGYETPFYMKD